MGLNEDDEAARKYVLSIPNETINKLIEKLETTPSGQALANTILEAELLIAPRDNTLEENNYIRNHINIIHPTLISSVHAAKARLLPFEGGRRKHRMNKRSHKKRSHKKHSHKKHSHKKRSHKKRRH